MTSSLKPHEQDRHRAQIGLRVEVILDGYWQTRPSDVVKAGILADWMDEMQDWHLDQITAALKEWRNSNPSRKPNPGHICAILKRRRGMVYAGGTAERDPVFALDRAVTPAIAAE